jgi:hypothetical protein
VPAAADQQPYPIGPGQLGHHASQFLGPGCLIYRVYDHGYGLLTVLEEIEEILKTGALVQPDPTTAAIDSTT